MATRALSGFCILFLILSTSHVLPSTEAARILDENKAAGIDGEDVSSIPYPTIGGRPQPGAPQRGNPYPGRCGRNYYRASGCPPPPPP